MSSILEEIFAVVSPTENSPQCQQVIQKQGTYYQAIQASFGIDFVNEFCDLLAEEQTVVEQEAFLLGCRTGYQLFSELACDSRYSS